MLSIIHQANSPRKSIPISCGTSSGKLRARSSYLQTSPLHLIFRVIHQSSSSSSSSSVRQLITHQEGRAMLILSARAYPSPPSDIAYRSSSSSSSSVLLSPAGILHALPGLPAPASTYPPLVRHSSQSSSPIIACHHQSSPIIIHRTGTTRDRLHRIISQPSDCPRRRPGASPPIITSSPHLPIMSITILSGRPTAPLTRARPPGNRPHPICHHHHRSITMQDLAWACLPP